MTSKSFEIAFTFVMKSCVQTEVFALNSMVRLCVLTRRLEQTREARERSQWDHIKVDQV